MFMALLGNDIFQYAIVITILVLLAVWRIWGLGTAARWLFLKNKPEARAKAKAAKASD